MQRYVGYALGDLFVGIFLLLKFVYCQKVDILDL